MPPAYEVLLLNTAVPQIQAAQAGDTYVVPRDIAFSAALTLSAGTANGVPYLNGSKVLTSGSALTFDGTNFATTGDINSEGSEKYINFRSTYSIGSNVRARIRAVGAGGGSGYGGDFRVDTRAPDNSWNTDAFVIDSSGQPIWTFGGSERMRLDSTGLGIGTSSPTNALTVGTTSAGKNIAIYSSSNGNNGLLRLYDLGGTERLQLSANSTGEAVYYSPTGSVHAWYINSEQMRLTSTGLGIGTSSPSEKLEVVGVAKIRTSGGSGVQIVSAATPYIQAFGASGNNVLQLNGQSIVFWSGASYGAETERARITSGGYFKASNDGAYISSAGSYHEIRQTSDNETLIVQARNASQTAPVFDVYAERNTTNNTFYAIGYYNTGAAAYKFRVADSGDVTNTNGTYGTISDAKMKTDIVDAGSQWSDIKALRFRKFKMKDDPDQRVQLGVVAQEVELTSPGLVDEHTDRDQEGNDLGTTTKSVKTSVLLMKAAVALQEAMARIETLEAEVAALKGN